jgi:hypothetical protein
MYTNTYLRHHISTCNIKQRDNNVWCYSAFPLPRYGADLQLPLVTRLFPRIVQIYPSTAPRNQTSNSGARISSTRFPRPDNKTKPTTGSSKLVFYDLDILNGAIKTSDNIRMA